MTTERTNLKNVVKSITPPILWDVLRHFRPDQKVRALLKVEDGAKAAKAACAHLLKQLLARPHGPTFMCKCCGHLNHLRDCTSINAKCFITELELRRYRCDGCGLIFGPIPLIECRPEELSALYGLLYKFRKDVDTRLFQEKTFYLMDPSPHRQYLNYACGDWSDGARRLRSLGWQVWASNPSKKMFLMRLKLEETASV
jgi:hypothetical protein